MFYTSMTVLGGDLRQCYLAEYMYTLGHDVICFGTVPFPFSTPDGPSQSQNLQEALSKARLVIGPTPFSKDGVCLYQETDGAKEGNSIAKNGPLSLDSVKDALQPGQILLGFGIPKAFTAFCTKAGILVWDFLDSPKLAQANAALTAEGLLAFVIAETSFSLKGKKALLLGHGRCGQEIVKLFTNFELSFTVLDRDPKARALAGPQVRTLTEPELSTLPMDFDLVLNTIPARILTRQEIDRLPQHCVLFDIASAPFGFELEHTGRRLVRCPGIPGKTMPRTAGEFLGKVITERMLSYGL